MLNLALVGLMASSLVLSPADDGKQGTDDPKAAAAPVAAAAGPSIFTPAAADEAPETVQDTYAFGRANMRAPLRLWVTYAYGEAEGTWNTAGDDAELTIAGTDGDIVSQRLNLGAQLGLPVSVIGFGLSAGAQVTMAKNDFQVGTAGPIITNNLESTFGLQQAKFWGELRAGAIGLHGGYHLDLGAEQEFAVPNPALGGAQIPTDLPNSDRRNALFFGADFDYPSPRIRLFGGVDYYDLYSPKDNGTTAADESAGRADNDIINAVFGLGLRFGRVFELGGALQMQTRLNGPVVESFGPGTIGGSAATISPYIRISPPTFPASFFVKGAVQNEYTEFGYAIGGSNSVKPSIGFTAGFTLGFN